MRKLISVAVPAIAATLLVSSATASPLRATSPSRTTGENIVQVAVADPQLSTLVTLVKKAGLVVALSRPGAHLTVFAPDNAAFAALKKADPMTFNAVATTPSLLKKVLTYHVLPTEVEAAAAIAAADKHGSVKTLEGEMIALSVKGGGLYLNGSAEVIKADVPASNGVIHVINAVLVPPSVKVSG